MAILPKRATYHVNLSRCTRRIGGDFQAAAKEAAATLQLNPSYPFRFPGAGIRRPRAGPTSLRPPRLTRTLEKLRASDAAMGLADLAVYEGRFSEAVTILQKGAAEDRAARSPDNAADKFALLAYAQLLRQQNGPALEAAKSALELSQSVKIRFLAAQVFVAAGETAKAQELATGLGPKLQIEPQAYAKLIEGEAALKSKDGPAGRQTLHRSQQSAGYLDRPFRSGPRLSGGGRLYGSGFRIRPVYQAPRRGSGALSG